MSHTESSLKTLTVPKLKELLTELQLAVTGKKDELIARILESQSSAAEPAPVTAADPVANVEPVPAVADPAAPAAATTTPAPAPEAAPAASAKPELSAEEKQKRVDDEEEKRRKRAEKFGIPFVPKGGVAEETEEEKKKRERAEKYGTGAKAEDKTAASNKSIDKLDQPLSERKQKQPKPAPSAPTSATAPKPAAATPKSVDPELQKKIAEEEEKKRKRAERFGEPEEKKAKVDA
ncbi:hypothetical protein MNV49_000501 [Pseudohyphozyma bogoriensis]|nr:hypothetical protein MNV49_000501 [Pseudohyphozyma bogoriensis]